MSEDGERIYTPHKAIRRIADHIVDHLADITWYADQVGDLSSPHPDAAVVAR